MEKIKPKRIQRKRTRGFKLSTDNPNGFVYVGRPTKWGNPYIPESPDEFQDAVDYYKSWQEVLIAKGYNPDFSYRKSGLVVEDVKSPVTRKLPAYRLKKKLMLACYGITIVEI